MAQTIMFRYVLVLSIFLLSFLFPRNIFAESSYVLPYPSAMPGSIFYRLNIVQEEILRYWYFGDFGRYKYNLHQSDKYLVTSKTLFEYKQYLLGWEALIKSNEHFKKITPSLVSAKNNKKNIAEKLTEYNSAKQKHIEVLIKMKKDSPPVVEWNPEKQQSSNLDLGNLIDNSIQIRSKDE